MNNAHAHAPSSRTDTRATPLQYAVRILNTIATVALHVGALLALLLARPDWVDVSIAVGFYVLGMFVITVGYHRYFAHRSYKTSRVFQALLAFAGCFCTQKGALWWAATHRLHHRYTDLPGDPHSPRQQGFCNSHILWTLSREHEGYERDLVRDLEKFPELRWLDRFCALPLLGYLVTVFALRGFHGVGWWYCVPTVALMHAVMLVNSVSHMYGRRHFDTADDSRNNAWLAWITFGEGWHNNHHRAMTSARFGFFHGEVDLGYRALQLLRKLGVVWQLREPSREVLDEGVRPPNTGAPRDGEQPCAGCASTT